MCVKKFKDQFVSYSFHCYFVKTKNQSQYKVTKKFHMKGLFADS